MSAHPAERFWGVQLDEEGSMDLYESEAEAREAARGCPVWAVTYEPIPADAAVRTAS